MYVRVSLSVLLALSRSLFTSLWHLHRHLSSTKIPPPPFPPSTTRPPPSNFKYMFLLSSNSFARLVYQLGSQKEHVMCRTSAALYMHVCICICEHIYIHLIYIHMYIYVCPHPLQPPRSPSRAPQCSPSCTHSYFHSILSPSQEAGAGS